MKDKVKTIITNIAYDAGDGWVDLDNPYTEKYLPEIEAVVSDVRQETLLDLLAYFDDYSHPIMMDAEYVREQIIRFMEYYKNEKI